MLADAGRRVSWSVALLVAGTVAIGGGYASAIITRAVPVWAPWALAFGCAAMPVGLFVLGAARSGRLLPLLRAVFGFVFFVVSGSFAAALLLPAAEGSGARVLLGLPLRTAIVFYGVGFVPLVILPLAYGLSFRTDVLTDDDLERLRAAGRKGGMPEDRAT